MKKSDSKKNNILKVAFDLSSRFGLESLSIGKLADSVGMSKSGLFGHFKSKEKLQIMVLDYAASNFTVKVITPSFKEPRGICRLNHMISNWQLWCSQWLPGGCPILSAIIEFGDKPGPVQNHVKKYYADLVNTFKKAIVIAQEENQIRQDVDKDQLVYEIFSSVAGYQLFHKITSELDSQSMAQKSYKNILANYKN